MGKVQHVPTQLQLLDARIAHCLGLYSEATFKIVSMTLNTVTFLYAGHKIRYQRQDDRIKRKPKRPAGLQAEDINFLDNTARELLHAYAEGHRILKEIRQEEVNFNKRVKAQLKLNEELAHPQQKLVLSKSKSKDSDPL
jgi:hypothetical protein